VAASCACGVGQAFDAMASGMPMPLPLIPLAFAASCRARKLSGDSPSLKIWASGVGHGEDEQALADVARADFRRREQSSLNLETKSA